MRKLRALTFIAVCIALCGAADVPTTMFQNLVEQALQELDFQLKTHDKIWKMNEAVDSRIDQNAGTLAWHFGDGSTVVAPVQIVGTYNPDSSSFLWSWANPSILGALDDAATTIKDYGKDNGITQLTERIINISEDEAWRLSAAANHLSQSNGVHKARRGKLILFMTFGDVKYFGPAESSSGQR